MLKAIADAQRTLYGEGKLSAYDVALTYADLDEDDNAIEWLKRSLARHETDNVAMDVDAPLARLRRDSRFRRLLSEAGLPD